MSSRRTPVFNNVYGWHYECAGGCTAEPFVATAHAGDGIVKLVVRLETRRHGWSGTLRATIVPETVDGQAYSFEYEIGAVGEVIERHLRFIVPDPHLWWPVDLGRPATYRLKLSFTPAGGGQPDYKEIVFGVRTIEMAPFPGGAAPDTYN
jgi:hypothetical protein